MTSREISHFFKKCGPFVNVETMWNCSESHIGHGSSLYDPIDMLDSTRSKKTKSEVVTTSTCRTKSLDHNNESPPPRQHQWISNIEHPLSVEDEGIAHVTDRDAKENISENQPTNPFAKFAFQRSSETAEKSTQWVATKRKVDIKKVINPNCGFKRVKADSNKNWVQMKDIPLSEQEKIRHKWHSLADETAPLEDRRFQVLVASRLHARCQETVVRRCMKGLRDAMGGQLTAVRLSKADPEVLVSVLSSLQFYNVKSKHIVKAAQEILSHFDGTVPESESDLQKITGVGPIMGDLLACINTRASYKTA